MASVHLNFVPPEIPDVTKLHIYEAGSADGPWGAPIETVTAVGEYPGYITRYTTNLAANSSNWFAIRWEDSKGYQTDISNPVRGGTTTVMGKIVDRVLQRDASLDENVVKQEAEAVLEMYFNNADPYDSALTATYRELAGLTLLVLARVYLGEIATSGEAAKWTAGLVSYQTAVGETRIVNLRELLSHAERDLNLNPSRIARVIDLPIAGGMAEIVAADISRLLVDVE